MLKPVYCVSDEFPALAPTGVELWTLTALVGLYFCVEAFVGESSHTFVNVAGPLFLSAILGVACVRLIRADAKYLWTPLFWFRLSTIVYFGFGTFLIFVVDLEARRYLESFFWFFDQDVFKLNVVVSVGVLLALLAARVVLRGVTRNARVEPSGQRHAHDLPAVALLFLAVGLTISYAVKVPYDLGWIDLEVPGSLMNLARLKLVGIFLITLWAKQRGPWALPLIICLVILDLLCQALLFAKGEFLILLLIFLMAFMWEKASPLRLAVCGALVAGSFGSLQPIITDGRVVLEQRYGEQPQAGLIERAEIIRAFFTDERLPESVNVGASALTRLTYVNAATLVITSYDSGQPGDWPTLLPAVFVPRFLWPSKPIISDVGRDIYELGTGRRTSQSGAGLFADAYWAMGWWGITLFMPVYGLILGLLTVMTMRFIRDGRWLYFPVVLMAMRIGFRTDGHYLADVAGAVVILVGTLGCLWILSTAMSRLQAPSAVPQRGLAG